MVATRYLATALCASGMLWARPGSGQTPTPTAGARGVIVGQVVNGGSQQPVDAAQVSLVGTTLGGVTNERGRFAVSGVPTGTYTLRVTRIGYGPQTRPVTLTGNDTVTVEFRIAPVSVQLNQVVVTGTAGTQVRRAQPAVVADVAVSELARKAPVNSVAEVLQGRVAGVSVQQSSGTSGTSQSIRIRGASSISLSNEPLLFIDGVRADSRNLTSGRGNAGACSGCDIGGQATSRLNDINPDEIESIEIVKGPAAATLYGADASAGVIQIITKKGRLNAGRLQQALTLEYAGIDPNYTPPDNYAACTTAMVASTSVNPLCRGQQVGTIIQDNPLVRGDVFRTGSFKNVAWNGHGGGTTFGYFASGNYSDEDGTLPSNYNIHRDGRFNFRFQPSTRVLVDAGYALVSTGTRLPDQGNNPYGFGGALIANPLTLGGPNNGWNGAYRDAAAIAAINNTINTLRNLPRVQLQYTPAEWFTHRLTVGGDLSRSSTLRLIPKNSLGSYFGLDNTGSVKETRYAFDQYTVDYLGNVKTGFFRPGLTSDFSVGAQLIDQSEELVWADGTGLATNSARAVSAAATKSGGQTLTQQKSLGVFGQWQLTVANRLYLQLGARVDRNTGFGENVPTFFLPKAGVSYVLSEEPFWQARLPWFSSLRLRAAYGTTGRAPTAGAAAQTYQPCPFIAGGAEAAGVCLLNPGNPNLRPEKGTEFEGGADAGFLRDRIGAEVTYFHKKTTDLLLRRPIATSLGYLEQPFANVGEVVNSGLEVALRARLLDRARISWDANVNLNTLHNELVSLGGLAPFGTTQRFQPGYPLGAFWGYKVERVDEAAGRAVVTNDRTFLGNLLPTFEGGAGSTVTLLRNLRLYGQVEWKTGHSVYNNTRNFRERTVSNARERVDTTVLSRAERIRRFGPYVTEAGTSVNIADVTGPYVEPGDFLRLREVSVTFTLPTRFASRLRASGASLTIAGRNLGLWTKYSGPDPEIRSNIITTQFDQSDFLTFPPSRRLEARIGLQF